MKNSSIATCLSMLSFIPICLCILIGLDMVANEVGALFFGFFAGAWCFACVTSAIVTAKGMLNGHEEQGS